MYRRDQRFKHTYEAVISETNVDITGPTSASQQRWENFIGYKETPNTIVLFQSPFLFNVFPKSAFSSDDLTRFIALGSNRLPVYTPKGNQTKMIVFLVVILLAAVLLGMAIWKIKHGPRDNGSSLRRAHPPQAKVWGRQRANHHLRSVFPFVAGATQR
jgi:hypothetical protein